VEPYSFWRVCKSSANANIHALSTDISVTLNSAQRYSFLYIYNIYNEDLYIYIHIYIMKSYISIYIYNEDPYIFIKQQGLNTRETQVGGRASKRELKQE